MDYKKKVLDLLGLNKLPKEVQLGSSFVGFAPVQIKKVSGEVVWAVGRFDKRLKKAVVAQDFKKGMITSIVAIYPVPEPEKVDEVAVKLKADKLRLSDMGYRKTVIKSWNTAKVTKELDDIDKTKISLEEKGIEDPRGTLDELKTKLAEIEA